MNNIRRLFVACAALVSFIESPLPAADTVDEAIKQYRKARGQAIAKENQNLLRWMEGALNQARQQKKTEEAARIEALMEQLRAESTELETKGDRFALLPTNSAQLRAYLIGSVWSVSGKASDARVFTEDGQFKAKGTSVPFSAVSGRRVNIIWSPTTRIDCEFNEDFTTMKELGGNGSVWKRIL